MGQSNPLQTFISCIFRIEKGLLLLGRMLKALRGKRFLSSLFTRLLIGAQHTRKTHSLHNTRTEDIGCERMINPYNSVVLIALFNCSKRHKPLQRSNLVPRTLPTSPILALVVPLDTCSLGRSASVFVATLASLVLHTQTLASLPRFA